MPLDNPVACEATTALVTTGGNIKIQTIAIGANIREGYEQLFIEYGRFRGRMYSVVNNIMPPDQLAEDGTEFDHYDDFAVHLAAIETVSADDGLTVQRVIGASRVIVDIDDEHHPYVAAGLRPGLGALPVEVHFPELTEGVDTGQHQVRCEASRYTALHRRPTIQRRTTLALRTGIAAHFVNTDGVEVYAVLERPMADRLRRDGLVVDQLTRPRLLPEYGSVNFGVSIGLRRLAIDTGWAGGPISPFDITVGANDAVRR